MNFYNKILSATIILFVMTGCSKQLSYDELVSELPTISNSQIITNSTMKYDISLPKELKLAEKQYNDTLWFEFFLDKTIPFEEGTNIVSVLRILSKEKTPKDVWQKLLEKKLMNENYSTHSKGESSFLNYPSYYAHCSKTISNKNRETIIFIVRGNSSDYYMINLETGTEKNYPNNMKQLLSCVKTFNILK
ncbi:MAG: hypothetical protein JNL24_02750 [Bacteroidia bacterium]|nr:hypothetical protein [Bacteroidia bacterium]